MAIEDPIPPWGATVKGVTDLLPAATFPETLEPGKKGVTLAQVAGYVDDLSGRVSVRLVGWERLDQAHQSAVTAAAKDLVHQGAASYAQAARYPEQSARNSDGYASVLWERFTKGLEELAGNVQTWLDDAAVTIPGPSAGATHTFPAPYFVDDFYF